MIKKRRQITKTTKIIRYTTPNPNPPNTASLNSFFAFLRFFAKAIEKNQINKEIAKKIRIISIMYIIFNLPRLRDIAIETEIKALPLP